MSNDSFHIRLYNHRELSNLYRCSEKTFRKWLRPIERALGPRVGAYFNPRQVKMIIEHLGTP